MKNDKWIMVRKTWRGDGSRTISEEYWMRCNKAWMPMPEPYREGEDFSDPKRFG